MWWERARTLLYSESGDREENRDTARGGSRSAPTSSEAGDTYTNVSASTFPGSVHNCTKERCIMPYLWNVGLRTFGQDVHSRDGHSGRMYVLVIHIRAGCAFGQEAHSGDTLNYKNGLQCIPN